MLRLHQRLLSLHQCVCTAACSWPTVALRVFAGPRTQFGHYWREGQFDLCQGPVKEFAFCMKLKFSDKDEAKVSNDWYPLQCRNVCETPLCASGYVARIDSGGAVTHHRTYMGDPHTSFDS